MAITNGEPADGRHYVRQGDLFVILHGFTLSSGAMQGLRELVEACVPGAEFIIPDLAIANICSTASPEHIADNVLVDIDRACVGLDVPSYERIWIVGHSAGSVLARKVVLGAFGAAPDLASGTVRRPWAERIHRLIFLAAVNRGWEPSSALTWLQSSIWGLGVLLGETVFGGRATILAFRRGAPFLTETRLQWLHLAQQEPSTVGRIPIVQIIGTLDDVVAPDCVVDFEIENFGAGQTQLLEAPLTGHLDMIEVALTGDVPRDAVRRPRREVISIAFGPIDEVQRAAIPLEFLDDVLAPAPEKDVDAVVFVMHGIRDRGFWTQKIARQVRQAARKHGQKVRAETSTYGYFTMLPFLFPWTRRAKVAWFMDRYAALVARHPKARFHYIGHSNGTYLLARALQDYQSARFENVVFAGSVVRSDYNWSALVVPAIDERGKVICPAKVRRVMNYVASGDFIVPIFPKALEPIRYFDLGGAGHSGFMQAKVAPGLVADLRYIKGRHGAGIRESQWDEIADFIVSGKPPPTTRPGDPDFVPNQEGWARLLGGLAPLPFLGIASLVVVVVPAVAICATLPLSMNATTLLVVSLLAYLWLLRIIVLRF
jgi:pimeloyl-ACP methyl ester carboxylesterase